MHSERFAVVAKTAITAVIVFDNAPSRSHRCQRAVASRDGSVFSKDEYSRSRPIILDRLIRH